MKNEKFLKRLDKRILVLSIWAGLENHGGKKGFYSGYIQALRDIKKDLITKSK